MATRDESTGQGGIDDQAWKRLREIAAHLDEEPIASVAKLIELGQEREKGRLGIWQSRLSLVTAVVSVLTLAFSVWNNFNTAQLLKRTSSEATEKAKREEMRSALDSLASNEDKIFGGPLSPDDWKAIFEVLKRPVADRALLVQAFDLISLTRQKARSGSDNDEQASAKNVAAAAVTLQPTGSPAEASRVLSGVLIYPQCSPDLAPSDRTILNKAIADLGGKTQAWQSVNTIDASTTVRYYHASEKPAADAVLGAVQSIFPNAGATLRSLENTQLAARVRQPMIEIWIGTGAR
jgi:hypothetical protein